MDDAIEKIIKEIEKEYEEQYKIINSYHRGDGDYHHDRAELHRAAEIITNRFHWDLQPEGVIFWNYVYNRLLNISMQREVNYANDSGIYKLFNILKIKHKLFK